MSVASHVRPIIRPFVQLDRVDKAREVFRLARKGMTVSQIAQELGAHESTISNIARDEGISIPTYRRNSLWPAKDEPGIEAPDFAASVKIPPRRYLPNPAPHMPRKAEAENVVKFGAPFNFMNPPAARNIIALVALRTGISFGDIVGPRRGREVTAARHEAIRLVFTHCSHLSTPAIGRLFNRDHTTILSAAGRTSKSRQHRLEKGEQ